MSRPARLAESAGRPETALCLVALLLLACAAKPMQNEKCQGGTPPAAIVSPTVRLVSANISHGRASALNQMFVSRDRTIANLDDIASLLNEANPDVVALQEADAASRWSGRFDHAEYLLSQTRFSCLLHGSHQAGWLAAFGTALLSTVALTDTDSIRFAPSPPTTTKGFVRATALWEVDGRIVPLTLVSVHLDFSRRSVRESQVDETIAALSGLETPLIIMGDINSDWSARRSSVVALAEALGLDAYLPEGPDLGTYKGPEGKRLDWILVSSELEFIDYRVVPEVVSDHLAVYAEIGLRKGERE